MVAIDAASSLSRSFDHNHLRRYNMQHHRASLHATVPVIESCFLDILKLNASPRKALRNKSKF